MTGTGEPHDGTGMVQGTDVEMYCPHVITDQEVIACKEKINQRIPGRLTLNAADSYRTYLNVNESTLLLWKVLFSRRKGQ